MDADLLQSRLDYFYSLGYISYHDDTKEYPLLPVTLLFILKVYSMTQGLSFPRVNANSIRKIDIPVVYVTDLGEKIFIKFFESMSTELFEMIAPVFKTQFTPATFVLSAPPVYLNLKGIVGKSKRKTRKAPLKIHLLVDNTTPFEYLQNEYIYDSIYEARLFINKIVQYLPPSRLELWRVREDQKTGQIRRDPEPVLITKAPYKV
jgi:hypothetical protein